MRDTETFDIDRWMIVATGDAGRSNLAAAAMLARLVACQPADGAWFPLADEELAADLQVSSRTVQRIRDDLVERGLVQCARRRARSITKMHWLVMVPGRRRHHRTRASAKRNELVALVDRVITPPIGVWVVYRHYDAAGVLLYVGRTKQFMARQVAHRSVATWWPDVRRITVDQFATFELCDAAELAAIRSERPRWNKADRR